MRPVHPSLFGCEVVEPDLSLCDASRIETFETADFLSVPGEPMVAYDDAWA